MSGSHCTAHWEAAFRLKHKNLPDAGSARGEFVAYLTCFGVMVICDSETRLLWSLVPIQDKPFLDCRKSDRFLSFPWPPIRFCFYSSIRMRVFFLFTGDTPGDSCWTLVLTRGSPSFCSVLIGQFCLLGPGLPAFSSVLLGFFLSILLYFVSGSPTQGRWESRAFFLIYLYISNIK